jgi:ribosomal protein S18 acetylase RimI-like enzyme
MSDIIIRPARVDDRAFIHAQYEYVESNGAPAWRTPENSPYTDSWIDRVIQEEPADQAILVAVDAAGQRLGYVWVLSLTEFDAVVPHGHIAGVAVSSEAQGRGVGSQLVAAAEAWCRDQNLSEVTLHCYMGNEGAHRLYGRLGFEDEWYQMRKGLD